MVDRNVDQSIVMNEAQRVVKLGLREMNGVRSPNGGTYDNVRAENSK